MSSIKLKGSTSGDVTITVPAVAGTNTVTIPAVSGNLPLSNLDHVTNRPNAKPFIINGNFAVAQRGTSATGTSAYLIDRWKKQSQTTGNVTVSQDTDAPTGFLNSEKILASGASTFFQTGQQIEYNNFYPLLGKAASLSFYYKSDVDVVIRIRTGTSTADSTVLFSGTVASTATISPSADWVQYVHNFTLASDVTSLSIEFGTGTLANTDFVYLAGVQLEQGTFDTTTIPPFQHESYGDNLSRCQRYYQRWNGDSAYNTGMVGVYNTTTVLICVHTHIVPMRTAATFSISAASDFDLEPFDVAPSQVSIFGTGNNYQQAIDATDTSARTKGFGGVICCDQTSGFFDFDAEF